MVVWGLRLKRSAHSARLEEMPMAVSAPLTFSFFDEHAEPVEAYTPLLSSAWSMTSPRTPGKLRFTMCGAACSGSGPLISSSGTAFWNASIRWSFFCMSSACICGPIFSISCTAAIRPAMPGVFSVPERRPFS